jgi:pimeloyl-ACP methyl ester carboxylesterase
MKSLDRIESHGYPFTFNVDAPSIILEKPTLILVGRQDSMVGYHDSWKILENYPRATLAVLDRAGHNLQIEQERLFNTIVDEWLNRVGETSARTRS